MVGGGPFAAVDGAFRKRTSVPRAGICDRLECLTQPMNAKTSSIHGPETGRLCDLPFSHFKIKQGGRIAGHDFCAGNVVDAIPYGVVEACTKFCKDFHWEFEYMTLESHGHFSFSLKRL